MSDESKVNNISVSSGSKMKDEINSIDTRESQEMGAPLSPETADAPPVKRVKLVTCSSDVDHIKKSPPIKSSTADPLSCETTSGEVKPSTTSSPRASSSTPLATTGDELPELEEFAVGDEDELEEEEELEDTSTVLGDDDDDADSVLTRLISPEFEKERESRKSEDRKLLALLAHFDEEQLNRFETFRRATFAKASVRRLIQSIATCAITQSVVIATAGLTKVYVGELVEEALDYKERLGEKGPLQPKHIREAYRLLNQNERACAGSLDNPLG